MEGRRVLEPREKLGQELICDRWRRIGIYLLCPRNNCCVDGAINQLNKKWDFRTTFFQRQESYRGERSYLQQLLTGDYRDEKSFYKKKSHFDDT